MKLPSLYRTRGASNTTPRFIPGTPCDCRIRPDRMTGRFHQIINARHAVKNPIERRELLYHHIISRTGWYLAKN